MSTEPFSYVNNNNSGYIWRTASILSMTGKLIQVICLDHKVLETLTMSVT